MRGTFTIVQPTAIVASIDTFSNVSCFAGNDGQAAASAIGGTGSYTYSWNTNPIQTTAVATNLAAGTYIVKITDTNGCSDTKSITIIDGDKTPPIINPLPSETTINCPAVPSFTQATATDNIDQSVILTFVDQRIEGTCAGNYSIIRTWTAKDNCGNVATATQKINVQDVAAPLPTTNFPAVINVTCDVVPSKPILVFIDQCSDIEPIVVYTERTVTNSANSYSIIRKWNVKDNCGNAADYIQTVNVTINTNTITINVPDFINSINAIPVDLTIYLPQDAPKNGTWTDISNTGALSGSFLNPNNLASGDYSFEYSASTATCPIKYVINLKIDQSFVLGCGSIFVHNAFSPDGDGINDRFKIDNIEDVICYPENTVEIYNRWGVLVYETKGYDNVTKVFKGYSEGRVTVDRSAGLPTGTYFYVLNYKSVGLQNEIITNSKQGYLYLTR
jgi:gliding motility-associated-like protein